MQPCTDPRRELLLHYVVSAKPMLQHQIGVLAVQVPTVINLLHLLLMPCRWPFED